MTDLLLRPFDRLDFDRLLGWIYSPEALMLWAGPSFHFPLDAQQLEAYRASGEGGAPIRRIYTACVADGEPIGHIELNEIDEHSARVCRVMIDRRRRGQGLGRAMVRQALQVGFDDLHLHRIDLGVFDFNTAAIRCYEAEGFVREGHLREVRRVGGAFWSLDLMAILEDEWRARRTPLAASIQGVPS